MSMRICIQKKLDFKITLEMGLCADPVIKRNMKQLPSDAIFIHCNVGDRTFWKDQNNVFRKDSKLRLTAVPTLLKFGHPNQLKEEQCMKDDLIQMLFTEE
ncbi:thioredoxin domain-containing protein 17 isoform X2 [Octopus bimaculoides]|uniref:thioredoxin domain-containing protein 17 isoform X2 n=1 Tax=Octopus bimaculoides TaxID=37653 RepID=UPI0022E67924|nr:thioredoxin domain-containing protein 17 isoform X2 [Octopus bimaculoides]